MAIGFLSGTNKILFESNLQNFAPPALNSADQTLLIAQSRLSSRDDIMDDFGCSPERFRLVEILSGLHADLVIPLMVKDQPMGWLFVGRALSPLGCSSLQVARLKQLAHEVAISLFLLRNIPSSLGTNAVRSITARSSASHPHFDSREERVRALALDRQSRSDSLRSSVTRTLHTLNSRPSSTMHGRAVMVANQTSGQSRSIPIEFVLEDSTYRSLALCLARLERALVAARSGNPVLELWRFWALLANKQFRGTLDNAGKPDFRGEEKGSGGC